MKKNCETNVHVENFLEPVLQHDLLNIKTRLREDARSLQLLLIRWKIGSTPRKEMKKNGGPGCNKSPVGCHISFLVPYFRAIFGYPVDVASLESAWAGASFFFLFFHGDIFQNETVLERENNRQEVILPRFHRSVLLTFHSASDIPRRSTFFVLLCSNNNVRTR